MKKIIILLAILLSFFVLKSILLKKPPANISKKETETAVSEANIPKTPLQASKEALVKREENMRRIFITRIQLMPKKSRQLYIDRIKNGELRDYPALVKELESYINEEPLKTAPPMLIENFKNMFSRMPKDRREERLESLSQKSPIFKRFPELKSVLKKELLTLDESQVSKRLPNVLVIENIKSHTQGLSPSEKKIHIERLKKISPLFKQYPDLEQELYK